MLRQEGAVVQRQAVLQSSAARAQDVERGAQRLGEGPSGTQQERSARQQTVAEEPHRPSASASERVYLREEERCLGFDVLAREIEEHRWKTCARLTEQDNALGPAAAAAQDRAVQPAPHVQQQRPVRLKGWHTTPRFRIACHSELLGAHGGQVARPCLPTEPGQAGNPKAFPDVPAGGCHNGLGAAGAPPRGGEGAGSAPGQGQDLGGVLALQQRGVPQDCPRHVRDGLDPPY